MRISGMHSWLVSLALLLPACGGDDDGGEEAAWTAVIEAHAGALLGVWGSAPDDVWVVGGKAANGEPPTALHWDGADWNEIETGIIDSDLWWVFGFPGGPVFAGGSNGTMLVSDGSGPFEPMTTPGDRTVFGIWGASPDDVWAVGGTLGGGAGGAFIWRYDGEEWTVAEGLPADLETMGTLWKIAGRGADDIWMSGTDGITLHWDGAELAREDLGVDASLFSVSGNAERFVCVGGLLSALLYENTGSGWEEITVDSNISRLSGVVASEGESYAVGREGAVLRRGDGSWEVERTAQTIRDLHAAWIDPDGGVWVVGGDFERAPTTDGVLIYKGDQFAPEGGGE